MLPEPCPRKIWCRVETGDGERIALNFNDEFWRKRGLIGSFIQVFQSGASVLRQQRRPQISEFINPRANIADVEVFDTRALL
jgi:hypothetical protein